MQLWLYWLFVRVKKISVQLLLICCSAQRVECNLVNYFLFIVLDCCTEVWCLIDVIDKRSIIEIIKIPILSHIIAIFSFHALFSLKVLFTWGEISMFAFSLDSRATIRKATSKLRFSSSVTIWFEWFTMSNTMACQSRIIIRHLTWLLWRRFIIILMVNFLFLNMLHLVHKILKFLLKL